jgi:cell division septal protein FtsQ
MTQRVRRGEAEEAPPVDPLAVDRAYRAERARRRARLAREQAARRAAVRFFVTVTLLLALAVFLSLTIWRQIERLFGL